MANKKPTRSGFISLGCPKNQIDTEVMLRELVEEGYELTADETEADIIIVNTCAFIESAKKESIDNILDVAWLKKHRDLRGIIVTGCLAERYRNEVFEELPEVDALVGVGSIHDIAEAVRSVDRGSKEKYSSFKDIEVLDLGGDRVVTTPQYTAYLKIAEGCDNHCTYCAIPAIRGKYRSRPMEDIIAEARDLCSLGVKATGSISTANTVSTNCFAPSPTKQTRAGCACSIAIPTKSPIRSYASLPKTKRWSSISTSQFSTFPTEFCAA